MAKARRHGRRGSTPFKVDVINRKSVIRVTVPKVFSVIHNAAQMVTFLNKIKVYALRYNIELDLSGVCSITTDAVAALSATLRSITDYCHVRGTNPKNPAALDVLVESGFFQIVKSIEPIPICTKGRIAQKKTGKKVEPSIARDLIQLGTRALYGLSQHRKAAYSTIIECMNNTHNHASKPDRMKQTWLATVYADTQERRVCYTFVDAGVGIFRSLRIGTLKKAYKRLGLTNNGDILFDILKGKVESSTGMPYRGKGLPSIYKHVENGRIKSLTILANDVFANVAAGKYTILPSDFNGTLLYWETE